MRSLILVLLTALPSSACFAQLSITERLIQAEIGRLGGDWESGSKPLLIVFSGSNFRDEHFEMISHVRGVQHFYIEDVKASGDVWFWFRNQVKLSAITIDRCGELPNKLSLAGPRTMATVSRLRVSGCDLSLDFAKAVRMMESLSECTIEDCVISADLSQ